MSFVKIIRICETLLMYKHFPAVLGFGDCKMSRCGQECDVKLCINLTLNIFGAFAMLRKTTVSCAIPVCLSAWNSWVHAERFFAVFLCVGFFLNLPKRNRFSLMSEKSNRRFT